MGKKLFVPVALGNEADIIRITSTPLYKLGQRINVIDDKARNKETIQEYIYVFASINIIQFQPYTVITRQNINEECRLTTPPGALNFASNRVAVPQQTPLNELLPTVAIPAGFYGFAQLKGNGTVLVDTTYSANTFLRLAVNGTNLITTGSTPAIVAQVTDDSTATQAEVLFFGNLVTLTA